MATATKKQSKVKTAYNNAKNSVTNYEQAIKKAYAVGYKAGYNANKDIPDRFGTRHVAMRGFSKGIKNARQTKKYVK